MSHEARDPIPVGPTGAGGNRVQLRNGNATILNEDRLSLPDMVDERAEPILGFRNAGPFHIAIIA